MRVGICSPGRGVYPSVIVIILVAALGCLSACHEAEIPLIDRKGRSIDLPETPLISSRDSWAVTQEAYIPLWDKPRLESGTVATLRKGDILSILSLSDWQEEIRGTLGCWYQVKIDGVTGWIFEDRIKRYSSEAQAKNAAGILENESTYP